MAVLHPVRHRPDPAHGGLNQQFDFVSSGGDVYRIRARHRGLVLQVANLSSGADITQQLDTNAANQRFQLQRA